MQRTIYDRSGLVKARLDEGDNSILNIYTRNGEMLGYYNISQDKTYTRTGVLVGNGDLRMSLIEY